MFVCLIFHSQVLACGSGGTATGLGLGVRLQRLADASASLPRVHGVCVCDSPEWFYDHVRSVLKAAGLEGRDGIGAPEEWLSLYDGQGLGFVRGRLHAGERGLLTRPGAVYIDIGLRAHTTHAQSHAVVIRPRLHD